MMEPYTDIMEILESIERNREFVVSEGIFKSTLPKPRLFRYLNTIFGEYHSDQVKPANVIVDMEYIEGRDAAISGLNTFSIWLVHILKTIKRSSVCDRFLMDVINMANLLVTDDGRTVFEVNVKDYIYFLPC